MKNNNADHHLRIISTSLRPQDSSQVRCRRCCYSTKGPWVKQCHNLHLVLSNLEPVKGTTIRTFFRNKFTQILLAKNEDRNKVSTVEVYQKDHQAKSSRKGLKTCFIMILNRVSQENYLFDKSTVSKYTKTTIYTLATLDPRDLYKLSGRKHRKLRFDTAAQMKLHTLLKVWTITTVIAKRVTI